MDSIIDELISARKEREKKEDSDSDSEEESEGEMDKLLGRLSQLVNTFSPKKNKKRNEEPREEEGICHHYIEGIFYKGKECFGIITGSYFAILDPWKKPYVVQRFPHDEMFGVHRLSSSPFHELDENNPKYGLYLACLSKKSRKVQTFEILTKSSREEQELVSSLQQVSLLGLKVVTNRNVMVKKDRNLLVFINPMAGSKKSEAIFKKEVEPILKLCHLQYTPVVTEYAGHASDVCRSLNIERDSEDNDSKTPKYTEIMTIGGDGMIHEIIQGLFSHPKMNYTEIHKIAISIIPCGTGNALSWGMGCDQNPRLSTLIAARGRTVPFDVMSIVTPSEKIISFLFFAYGVLPDVDLGYKPLKFLGDVKYAVGGFCSCVKRSLYPMKLQYVMKENETSKPTDPYVFPSDRILNLYKDENKNEGGALMVRFLEEGEKKVDPPLTLLEEHFGDDLKKMLESQENKKKKKKKKKKEVEEESEEEEEKSEEEEEEKSESEEEEEEKGKEVEEESEEESESEEVEEGGEQVKESSSEEDESESGEEIKQEEQINIMEEEQEGEDDSEDDSEDDYEEEEEGEAKTVLKELEEPVFFLSISNSRKFAYDIWASGNTSPGNGYVDLLWVEKLGFVNALSTFLKMMGSASDGHIKGGSFKGKRILGFKFEALEGKKSLIDIDGEEKSMEPVLGMVHKGLLRICHIEKEP